MKITPKSPKLLPWLAKKAGITEQRATALWHDATRWAEKNSKTGSSAYYKLAVDRFTELVAAESLREDAASFGWRPWARAQARLWAATMHVAHQGSVFAARSLRAMQQLSH